MAKASSKLGRNTKQVPKHLFTRAFLFAGVCCLALFVAMKVGSVHSISNNPAIGKTSPQLDLIMLSGNEELSTAKIELDGNITLLHFWGTWCAPCRMEYPLLVQAIEPLAERTEFQFIPVACQGKSRETFEGLWEKTSTFFESEGIKSVAFADPLGITQRSMVQRLEQPSLYYPTSVLIGRDGKIAGVWEGYSKTAIAEITAMAESLTAL
jgi:thiol-disulfide isomerase/thioredoxin